MIFDGLFDDASLFPPASLGMRNALHQHAEHQQAWYADVLGPFVCAQERLDELTRATELPPEVIVLASSPEAVEDALAAAGRLVVAGVEVRASDAADVRAAIGAFDAALPEGVVGAVEIADPDLVAVLAGTRYRAKLRTGGVSADSFPPEHAVARFIDACVAARVAFKCTAGLHHAVRGSADGLEHHGFLNILAAVDAAEHESGDVRDILAERDAKPLVDALAALTPERTSAVRARLTSIGTCSVAEPVDDLVALGLLAKP